MRFIRWLGGGILVAGATIALLLSTANAQQGWPITTQLVAPVVLSGVQKTSVGNWAASVWAALTPSAVASISCEHRPPFAGRWGGAACEAATLSDDEFVAAEIAGADVSSAAQKCYAADSAPPEGDPPPGPAVVLLTVAKVNSLLAAARNLGSLESDEIPASVTIARTPGAPTRITATVSKVAVLSPAEYRAARARPDQPGGVARLVGVVQ